MTDYLVNGNSADSIQIDDRGFQYGDGLFETILVKNGCPLFLAEHLNRLQRGCDVLAFPAISRSLYNAEISSIISSSSTGILKIILSRGVAERGFLPPSEPTLTRVISFSAISDLNIETLQNIHMILCKTRLSIQPRLAGIKHLNQLERVLARSEWRNMAIKEGLMLDMDAYVIEGTMSNIFVVNNGILKTSHLKSSGVKGVMRDFVLLQAEKIGYSCKEVALTLNDVREADEVFITNSIICLQSVVKFSLADTVIQFKQGPLAMLMFAAIQDEITEQCEANSV
ncbi:MAG: aminodeoxychorismate lyase [Piscirickettsiaceae bacterium]|nr:MAG: aminodeoxychorismate lyase [Piscirickettsiaceae bacterium]